MESRHSSRAWLYLAGALLLGLVGGSLANMLGLGSSLKDTSRASRSTT